MSSKKVAAPAVQEVVHAPIVTTIIDKPIVDQVEEKVNVFVHKQPVITEIIEQPVIELHESREVKHIREKSVTGAKLVESTVYQDFGVENKLTESQKRLILDQKLKEGQIDQKAYEEQLREIVIAEEALLKRVEFQPVIERHNQTLVKEVHERNVHQVVEQPIVRRVYEKPIYKVVSEPGVHTAVETTSVSQELKSDAREIKREVVQSVKQAERKLEAVGQEIKHEAKVIKQEAKNRGYLSREFLLPLGLFAAAVTGFLLYNKYNSAPVTVAVPVVHPVTNNLAFESLQKSPAEIRR